MEESGQCQAPATLPTEKEQISVGQGLSRCGRGGVEKCHLLYVMLHCLLISSMEKLPYWLIYKAISYKIRSPSSETMEI